MNSDNIMRKKLYLKHGLSYTDWELNITYDFPRTPVVQGMILRNN